eukprot:CAMPEP_0179875120 /NCGR_PEP_ID=MMETSP0982-20121206/23329_1 /TAXON_ID=483367 /ORGANISM="non described non described, Strain CCMP 2436" /LENGTH=37 /DNA_ID= /DNA_START= /DNA_END= /DNA_ORIENTATION=
MYGTAWERTFIQKLKHSPRGSGDWLHRQGPGLAVLEC